MYFVKFLTVNAPETKDNDFTWNDFQLKNNSMKNKLFMKLCK